VLYAWNPLVLLESCLGAHNDVLVNTFMLLGIYLALRAEQKDFTRLRNYAAPLLVCSLAVLVKFTLLPLIALFLLLLGGKTFAQHGGGRRWAAAVGNMCLAGGIFVLFALVCYLPLWLGHSIPDIINSFSTPPSAWWAENSLLRILLEWVKVNGFPDTNSPLYPLASALSQRVIWDRITTGALAAILLVGAFYIWRKPTVYRLVVVLLAALCAVLVVTPWFFPWYVEWLIPLAVILLARPLRGLGRALLVFVFTFSLSALTIYLDPIFAPFSSVLDTRILINLGVPLLAMLLAFWLARDRNKMRPVEQDAVHNLSA
jgi:hypothetical protein